MEVRLRLQHFHRGAADECYMAEDEGVSFLTTSVAASDILLRVFVLQFAATRKREHK